MAIAVQIAAIEPDRQRPYVLSPVKIVVERRKISKQRRTTYPRVERVDVSKPASRLRRLMICTTLYDTSVTTQRAPTTTKGEARRTGTGSGVRTTHSSQSRFQPAGPSWALPYVGKRSGRGFLFGANSKRLTV